jgi:hypothetical protein
VSDLARTYGGVRRGAARYSATDDDWGSAAGRHAVNEDAVMTPIFHALTRGGWRSRQHAPAPEAPVGADPLDAFRRDPLTAPIPVQALAYTPAPSYPPSSRRPAVGAHAMPEARSGRHHRRFAVTS